MNDRIRATELRLITDDDESTVVSREEAVRMAEEQGLDLVVISLNSSPPVVKMVDYGRFKFELEKKAREAKKKQHVVEVKEIKMGIRIDDHDYMVKVNRAKHFLNEANKVKCTIRLKGREVQHRNLAIDLANRFVLDLQDAGQIEGTIRMESDRMITIHMNPLKQPPKASSKQKDDDHAEDENP